MLRQKIQMAVAWMVVVILSTALLAGLVRVDVARGDGGTGGLIEGVEPPTAGGWDEPEEILPPGGSGVRGQPPVSELEQTGNVLTMLTGLGRNGTVQGYGGLIDGIEPPVVDEEEPGTDWPVDGPVLRGTSPLPWPHPGESPLLPRLPE